MGSRDSRWAGAGLRPWSPHGLPFLGLLPGVRNLAIASGHFRNGILLAPVAAKLMAELLQGRAPSVDLTPFHPARAPAASPGQDT
ncbi:MAG: NAD(P)/FAD-dependent oxidoreductase [Candidatus Methylomirabilales bacterium]